MTSRFALAVASIVVLGVCLESAVLTLRAEQPAPAAQLPAAPAQDDPVRTLVGRLDLEKYKATIKGLTQFGDRRQGTDRNRAAVDWIEAQLKSYGCTNTERIKYDYAPPAAADGRRAAVRARRLRARAHGGAGASAGQGARRRAGPAGSRDAAAAVVRSRQPRADRRQHRSDDAARRKAPRAQLAADNAGAARRGLLHQGRHHAPRRDVHRRRAHGRASAGAKRPTTTGRARRIVMELARIFSSPDVQTDRSIRFALWNNEETGPQRRARLRRAARGAAGQGRSARLGQVSRAEVARHGSARHDDVRPRHAARGRHGQQGAAARGGRQHRVPGDVEDGGGRRRRSRGRSARRTRSYATDYPAAVGNRMTNTDSTPFMDHRRRHQPARERARHADRQRLGSALASADGRVRDLLRQGFPPRAERGADDARRRSRSSRGRGSNRGSGGRGERRNAERAGEQRAFGKLIFRPSKHSAPLRFLR